MAGPAERRHSYPNLPGTPEGGRLVGEDQTVSRRRRSGSPELGVRRQSSAWTAGPMDPEAGPDRMLAQCSERLLFWQTTAEVTLRMTQTASQVPGCQASEPSVTVRQNRFGGQADSDGMLSPTDVAAAPLQMITVAIV